MNCKAVVVITDCVGQFPKGLEGVQQLVNTFGGRREPLCHYVAIAVMIGQPNSFAVGGVESATKGGGAPKGAVGVQPFHGLKGGCGALHRVRNTTK